MKTNSSIVESHAPCPKCGSSDARTTYADGHGFCFSCKAFSAPNGKWSMEEFTYEYLPWRGVTAGTMEFYGVKTRIDVSGKPNAIIFNWANQSNQVRLLEKKAFFTQKGPAGEEIGKAGLFGKDKFNAGSAKSITITEGPLDALSLYQVLKSPVVSVQSAATASRDCILDRDYVNSFDTIYLAFDGDAAGRDAVQQVARLFDYNRVRVVRFSNRKDANDYLKAGDAATLMTVWHNAKRYLPDTVKSSLDEFKEILEKPVKQGFPYPFKQLTDMTYGIRTGETVLFIAPEKVGKTEVMHAIEHKWLKETDDAVGAIYIEEPPLRHLQALAGFEIGRPVHLPDSGCTVAETQRAIEAVVRKDERLHIYTHFGSSDPEVLLDTVRFLATARSCRLIILDHLTMVHSGGAGDVDERRAIDYLSTKLEMMVKELDFALVMVSHVNDQGQTRGSRYPTKVADITISASRDLQHPDPVERSTMHLRVLYNRFCGKTGYAGSVIFNPDTYSFTEITANDNLHSGNQRVVPGVGTKAA